MEQVMIRFKSDTPFPFMGCEHQMCKTSNAAGHPGSTLTQILDRLRLILLRKVALGMARRLLHPMIGVEVEVGKDSISIQNLGKSHILSYASALSRARTNFSWNLL